jgi:hypothetical protein
MERPLPAFFSYAHKQGRDRRHLSELFDALASSRRTKLFDNWDDREIRAGQQWEDIILQRARGSRIFLLIVTNRFIASDFCVAVELTIARALYGKRAAAIAPILAEDANWEIDELRDLQFIMPFGRPVTRVKGGWTQAAKVATQMAEDLLAGAYFKTLPEDLPPIPPLLPFTIGRQRETVLFENALRAADLRRSFICVVTGERQGQKEFTHSLLAEDNSVRKILGVVAAHNPLAVQGDAWVRGPESVESLVNAYLTSHVVPKPPSPDREGIAASLAAHPGLSVVTCELSATEWRECGDGRFEQLLAYWSGWPGLNAGRPLLVFVVIGADAGDMVIPGGICLRLGSVTPEILDRWLATPAAGSQFVVERLRQHFDKIFDTQHHLRMEEFACRFLPLLRRFQLTRT